jgi:hypothetical protein
MTSHKPYLVEASYDSRRGEFSFRNFVADMLLVYYLILCAEFFERLGRDERFD